MTKSVRETFTQRLYVREDNATLGEGWRTRHNKAVRTPSGFERPIVRAFQAWLEYADMHAERYGDKIGTDYVLGPAWLSMAVSLRDLLNGETGNLDCATLDAVILNTANSSGFPEETLQREGLL